ncbi:MAG: hypothetical protein AAF170_09135 [Bacteroidota bacterium]
MRLALALSALAWLAPTGIAQDLPTKHELVQHFGFEQRQLDAPEGDIVYYTYDSGEAPPSTLVMYLQGSDPSPQFSYRLRAGEVQRLSWLKGEHQDLPDGTRYVVVEKVGFEGLIDEDNIPTPQIYQEQNSLDHRVSRADAVIRYLVTQGTYERILVYGHSEGAPVAAKLGTVNPHITHLGFWAGNALPDFFDFILEARVASHKGEITDAEAQEQIDAIIGQFTTHIAADTAGTSPEGYTNLRWWSYAEPPIHHLVQLDIPLYVQVATLDTSAPIESTYLIPLEFARLGKDNLSYNVCVGCDHGFIVEGPDGTRESRWRSIFADFLQWTEAAP